MASITFSVVVPTRDRLALVEEAVASVLAQDFADFEVIVVDDGSAQGPPTFQDSRVQVISLPQGGGAATARNVGIARTRGQVVCFLDDDDLWPPDFLSRVFEQFVPSDCSFCWSGVRHWDNALGGYREFVHQEMGDWHSPHYRWIVLGLGTGYGICAKREVLELYGDFWTDLQTSEDFELLLRWQKADLRGMRIEGPPITIRLGTDNQQLTGRFLQRAADLRQVLDRHQSYLAGQKEQWCWARQLLATYYRDGGDRVMARRTYLEIIKTHPLYPGGWLDLLELELSVGPVGRRLAAWVHRFRMALR